MPLDLSVSREELHIGPTGDSVQALWMDNRYYPASVTSKEI